MGIDETLHQTLDKLVMRAAGDQGKTVCVNLQLCALLEAVIEGATYAMVQRRLGRTRAKQQEGEEAETLDEEEESDKMATS